MSIRKEEAYQHALCMDLQTDGFSYAIVSKDSNRIVHTNHLAIEDFDRDAISPLLAEELLTYDYGSITATGGGARNTLMPIELFNHSKPEEIFLLNYPKPIDNLDYNRIPELGIVNIYEIPLWIKSMLVIKFPRVKLVHPSTVLLKGVFQENNWKPKISIYLSSGSFYLIISAKNKLLYFNRWDHTNLADLVYHTLFVLEQKELDQEKMEIYMYGVDSNWDQLDEMQGFFKNKINLSEQREKGQHFVLANQLLCV